MLHRCALPWAWLITQCMMYYIDSKKVISVCTHLYLEQLGRGAAMVRWLTNEIERDQKRRKKFHVWFISTRVWGPKKWGADVLHFLLVLFLPCAIVVKIGLFGISIKLVTFLRVVHNSSSTISITVELEGNTCTCNCNVEAGITILAIPWCLVVKNMTYLTKITGGTTVQFPSLWPNCCHYLRLMCIVLKH